VNLNYNRRVKRLILSLVCGFAFPFLYSLIAAPLSSYVENERLRMLLGFPVRWPLLIYRPVIFLPTAILFLLLLGGNVLVYGTLSYFILWKRSSRRTHEIEPPPPPSLPSA